MTPPNKTYLDEKSGYYRFKNRPHRLYHRWVKEQEIGRKLKPTELVHHKNGNKLDNSYDNLEIVTFKEHLFKHFVPLSTFKEQQDTIDELEVQLEDQESQISKRLLPIFTERAIKAYFIGFTYFGAVLLIAGLIIRVKVELWFIGFIFLVSGLVGRYLERRNK